MKLLECVLIEVRQMKASYDITIKFTMVHEVDETKDIIDPHDVAQYICDELTSGVSVAAYEVIETTIDVR